ncbi:3073_t:CDS:2 [Paraglomus occultum]|uniref:Ribophorin II n=1 Tax=Paraglomus occultum TaxID=144539 RepID=A0A9N9B0V2_9GLOM|nr:3073_t:CDS:2 [Paraglomus occultum]
MTRACFPLHYLKFLLVVLILFASTRSDGAISIQNLKLTVITPEREAQISKSLAYPETLSSPLILSPDDTFKLSLNIQEKDSDKAFHPHQALLTLTDEKTREQYLLVIKVREKGKARVELDMKAAPDDLTSHSGNYSMEIILGTPSHSNPFRYRIGTLNIEGTIKSPRKAPIVYGPRPEIHHVFRDGERSPSLWISYTFSIIALTPWIVLVGGWKYIKVNLSLLLSKPTESLPVIAFLSSLLAMETLLFGYWISLNLLQTLPWLAASSLVAFVTGQRALTKVQTWRLDGLH